MWRKWWGIYIVFKVRLKVRWCTWWCRTEYLQHTFGHTYYVWYCSAQYQSQNTYNRVQLTTDHQVSSNWSPVAFKQHWTPWTFALIAYHKSMLNLSQTNSRVGYKLTSIGVGWHAVSEIQQGKHVGWNTLSRRHDKGRVWSGGENVWPNVEVLRPDSVGGCFVYSCKVPAAVERLRKIRVRSLKFVACRAHGIYIWTCLWYLIALAFPSTSEQRLGRRLHKSRQPTATLSGRYPPTLWRSTCNDYIR